ncbi:MAG TPA: aromatic amino acid ammonia-lyase [Vicinamibacterales bacterium]
MLDDRQVSFDSVVQAAVDGRSVELARNRAWRRRLAASREVLEHALDAGQTVYGVSTGVGNNSSRAVDRQNQIDFAISVMEQHGCGVGDPLSEAEGRAVTFARLVSLTKGLSAVRPPLLDALCALLNHRITPVIPRWGSVGASGDLTPLSYVAAVLAGQRKAYYRGRIVDASRALAAEGLEPWAFGPKETLAIMNGTSVMTAVGILAVARFERLIEQLEGASALATEVLLGRSQAFDPLVHAAKPHPGQIETARRVRQALRGSRLLDPPHKNGRPVQDRYSIRCVPQAAGVARDVISWARQVLQIELNSVNDNPLVDPESKQILFGGNFFGGHPAVVMDTVKIAAASMADLIDRQFALLVDEGHNMGMPETLVPYGGCGVKGLQMTCSALTELAVQRSFPDAVLSRSTECANQDKVSMGLQAALHASEIIGLVGRSLATEMIALSNAAALREESRLSPAGRALLVGVRRRSAVLVRDRPLDVDIERVARWLEAGGAR